MRDPAWRQQGKDPDYRFSLANERTFLAWIRTALALLAGGVVLDQLSIKFEPPIAAIVIAIMLCTFAAALCAISYSRWRGNEIAMRHAQQLPHNRAVSLLAGCLFIVAATFTVLLAMNWR